VSIYVEVIPDGCRCKWVNYSDDSGWEMRWRNTQCIHHGDQGEP
jgi:hypothetical protein